MSRLVVLTFVVVLLLSSFLVWTLETRSTYFDSIYLILMHFTQLGIGNPVPESTLSKPIVIIATALGIHLTDALCAAFSAQLTSFVLRRLRLPSAPTAEVISAASLCAWTLIGKSSVHGMCGYQRFSIGLAVLSQIDDEGLKGDEFTSDVYLFFLLVSTVGPGTSAPVSVSGKLFCVAYFFVCVHHWRVLSRYAARNLPFRVGLELNVERDEVERTSSKDTLKMV